MSCSLLLVGKLAARQEDVFSLPASTPDSSLIYLQDLLFSRRFLVVSGASVSTSAPVYVCLQLTILLSPVPVPESSHYILDPTDLIGFDWL